MSKAIDKAAGAERTPILVPTKPGNLAEQAGQIALGATGITDISRPITPAAVTWQGWGTALKPAFEPIVVGRKPLRGTVAANVLAYGTGALNIDGCRVAGEVPSVPQPTFSRNMTAGFGASNGRNGEMSQAAGRWPTNVVLDGSQADALDAQSGALHTQDPTTRRGTSTVQGATTFAAGNAPCYDDAPGTGASRFFPTFRYEAKAPTIERPRHGEVAHPTVKPLDLMRWLVRLVTPPRTVSCYNRCYETTTQGRASTLQGMREGVQTAGQQSEATVLLEGVREQGDDQTTGAEDVPDLFAHLHADADGQARRDVLLKGVRVEGERTGEAEAPSEDGEGILGGPATRAPNGESSGLHPGAPAGDGRALGQDAAAERGRPSSQRDQDGQPSGEPRGSDEGSARPNPEATTEADQVPTLRGFDRSVGACEDCGGPLVESGGICLDPFAGSGTTAEACVIEGFKCIAIEREADYLPLIVQRLSKPIEIVLDFGGVA